MRLYLAQHGEALSKTTDPDRPLSERGRREVAALAAFLHARGISAGAVFHSGKTRARQSAELLAARIAPDATPETLDNINPNDMVAPLLDIVDAWAVDTLVVGHLPFMAKLVTRLAAESEEPVAVNYRPGSIVCLERDTNLGWVIDWMLRPELVAGH